MMLIIVLYYNNVLSFVWFLQHRCMQPKDSPERTPENDRRMRKKLDKMMKDLAPKQPIGKRPIMISRRWQCLLKPKVPFSFKDLSSAVTDVSPIIIDQESGIVYSPALKRSDYMAQRLKDMKEKRENLSPTGMCNRCRSWLTSSTQLL